MNVKGSESKFESGNTADAAVKEGWRREEWIHWKWTTGRGDEAESEPG